MFKAVEKDFINKYNKEIESDLNFDYSYLEKKLRKENIDINEILNQLEFFRKMKHLLFQHLKINFQESLPLEVK